MSDREDGYVLSKSPCHLLHRVQQLAADRFGVSDVTLRQFTVLAAVSSRAGQTQTDLVNATGIDRSTLADMILRMEERGLLTRGRSAADGRAKSVGLTANGRSALASAAPRARQADEAIMAALPRSKRAPFLEMLRTLADAADEPVLEIKRPAAKTRKGARGPKKPRKASTAKRTARR
ncbi:MAG TPA: MarR family winged helix-turn-helix transcriptional regulator [Caulobacterales bacterium]|nr:MarR family winged helix-turn-helix transcriptional regulator [Caulobacterales bacterium]